MPSIRLTRLKFICVLLFLVVVHNEWLSFLFKSYSWQHLTPAQERDENFMKILLVADPQILSVLSEPNFPLSYVAVWDANRFVSRTYQMILQHTKPDIIIFLGDLINDGSSSTKEQFDTLVETYKSLFHIIPSVKCVFYIPGDNDIGGEGDDPVTATKIARFKQGFNVSNDMQCNFVSLFHLNAITIPGEEDAKKIEVSQLFNKNENLKILISHIPLLPGARKSTMKEIEDLKPSIIFSAHDHDSYKFVGRKTNPKAEQFWLLREEEKVWDFDLTTEELPEISVPTCSYRMGKQNYGYGFALVTKSGSLKYTVLWLPSRFRHLWLYFWVLCLSVSLLIYPLLWKIREKCTRKSSSVVDLKYHRV